MKPTKICLLQKDKNLIYKVILKYLGKFVFPKELIILFFPLKTYTENQIQYNFFEK